MIEQSDVISFHAYDNSPEGVQRKIDQLKKYNRPLLCTRIHGPDEQQHF